MQYAIHNVQMQVKSTVPHCSGEATPVGVDLRNIESLLCPFIDARTRGYAKAILTIQTGKLSLCGADKQISRCSKTTLPIPK